jgi:uncharacterized damage-inducible protein DinB
MQVTDLIRYNHTVRELYFNEISKLPWQQIVEARSLSWGSLRDVFVHLTLVEDRWINYIIPGRFGAWVDPDFENYKDIGDLKDYMQHVKAGTEAYLPKLAAEELNRQIVIPWGDENDTRISIETALTHMVLEDMIHYGELSAALWQMGLEAPYMAFWRYLHQKH